MPAGEKSGVFTHVHFTNPALLTEVVSRLEDNSIAFIYPKDFCQMCAEFLCWVH